MNDTETAIFVIAVIILFFALIWFYEKKLIAAETELAKLRVARAMGWREHTDIALDLTSPKRRHVDEMF